MTDSRKAYWQEFRQGWRPLSAATIGLSADLFLLSMLQGDIRVFYLLVLLQAIFCIGTATAVYCRVVAQYFPMGIYSSVTGLLISAVGVAIGAGSVLLSFTLSITDNFQLYTSIAGATVFAGSFCFLSLARLRPAPVIAGEAATL